MRKEVQLSSGRLQIEMMQPAHYHFADALERPAIAQLDLVHPFATQVALIAQIKTGSPPPVRDDAGHLFKTIRAT